MRHAQAVKIQAILRGKQARAELARASAAGERVVVVSHIALHPGACAMDTLLWNAAEVRACMAQHGCVALVLAGHDHKGGYHHEGPGEAGRAGGTHHLTLDSPLECLVGKGEEAFGTIEVFDDRLVLQHKGKFGPTKVMEI